MYPNKKDDAPYFETRVFCKIIRTKKDLDALVFEIDLGLFKIVCIANVPEEGLDSAPVYLKFKFNERPRGPNPRESPRDEPRDDVRKSDNSSG